MADKLSTQPYKGTRDFYPADMRFRRWMFGRLRTAVEGFGYEEYDGPLLEPFELYASKTSEEIVSQQLYWLLDRGERKMAIRPEMTPTLARMVAGKLQELPKPVRWYSIPNLWRYERPQRGRLREHWQMNVDVLGGDRLAADAEILEVATALFESFGALEHVRIKVNNRRFLNHVFGKLCGLSDESTLAVTRLLDEYFKIGAEAFAQKLEGLGLNKEQASGVVAYTGLRLQPADALAMAPYRSEGLDELLGLFGRLAKAGGRADATGSPAGTIQFDPCIVRGFLYYTGTVFEAYDVSPENTRALFGGGRYDDLLSLFGKQTLSGVGFGLGDVSLQNFLETHKLVPVLGGSVDVLVAVTDAESEVAAWRLLPRLRHAGLRAVTALETSGYGAQIKAASRLGARFVAILGPDERTQGNVALKNLATGEQVTVSEAAAVAHLRDVVHQD